MASGSRQYSRPERRPALDVVAGLSPHQVDMPVYGPVTDVVLHLSRQVAGELMDLLQDELQTDRANLEVRLAGGRVMVRES